MFKIPSIVVATGAIEQLVVYGYEASMTIEGPVIQGWLGTMMPTLLALIVSACIYVYNLKAD